MEFVTMGFILGAIIGGYLYFLPGVIAGYKKHKHRTAITLLNLIIGWTGIGWIGLLIWALTGEEKKIEYTSQLLNLYTLKEKGAITEEEFNREKAKILKDNSTGFDSSERLDDSGSVSVNVSIQKEDDCNNNNDNYIDSNSARGCIITTLILIIIMIAVILVTNGA